MGGARITDEAITAAIRAAGGNVSTAARALGSINATVFRRLRADPSLWPEGVGHILPGGGARREPVVPSSAITEALRAVDGNMVAAAAVLGVTPGAVHARVKKDPSLWPEGVRRRAQGQNGDLTDEEVTEALRAAGGSIRRAAAALGIRDTSIEARLARRPWVWPEGTPRGPGRRKRPPRVGDGCFTDALRAAGGDMAAAAAALGVTRQAVSARLKAHPDLWPEGVTRHTTGGKIVRGTAAFTGRRVGLLTLGELFRGADGARWAEARCDCGTVTAVRASHVTPGTRTPILSCGCLASGARRLCLAGRSAGVDVVVHDDGTDAVVVACPWGHAWTDARAKTLARVHTPSRSERTRSECPVCRVRVTVDMRGEVVGLLTVLRRAGTDARGGDPRGSQATWWVRCECGTEKVVRGAHLRREAHGVRTCGARECVRAWKGR